LFNRSSASRAICFSTSRAKCHTPDGPVTETVSRILGDTSFHLLDILSSFCGDISARSSFSSYCFRFACHALCICHLSVYSTLGFGDGDQGLWCTMPVGFSLGINDRISPYTDVKLPHYRSGTWTYTRGVLATMDRPFLGWQGRFFLHNVGHIFHLRIPTDIFSGCTFSCCPSLFPKNSFLYGYSPSLEL